jgi:hypothetical protein
VVSGLVAQYGPAPMVLPYAIHVVLLAAMLIVARPVPDSGGGTTGPLLRIELSADGWRRFRRGVAPMAPFVFGFPAIVLAVLPSMLSGGLGSAPIAYTGVLALLMLGAGVLVQPVTRRLEPMLAARLGLLVGAAGVVLGAATVAWQLPLLLLAVAPLLGVAYGVCMTAGLQAVQRLAEPHARGGVTGLYYVLTYVGFAAPYLLALATRVTTPVVALGVTTAAAAAVALTLPRAR